ncbi:Nucleotidyltransferase/DNA polymerase involved in DNA repair-like protein [Candidatus Sulfopaludibacter sp. SbA6]|nr:Nucleotidyltransferase/DNA polymerase involved in DNA repair-like protein [Candidatus Sulfopaludibacter sp. SbA6]
MFACLHGQGNLTALAFEFSPTVERTAPLAGRQEGTVTLDASGLDRLFGLPQDVAAALARRAAEVRVKANIALAANPDAAICAARGFAGVSVIPQGDEGKFLGTLPLAVLAPTPELQETLERWGIRRFQELAALPPLGIAERLGPQGLRLRELARGEAERKLVPLEEPLHFEDEIEMEYPVELLEPLAFVLSRLLNGLATRLATRGLATDEMRLRLKLENRSAHERTLRLPVPSTDTKAFLKLWQLDLAAHPPQAPVVHVWMGVSPVKPQAAQGGLFVLAAPEPVKLELTLARIRSIVGEGRAGTPELLDTHRPNSFRMTPIVAHALVRAASRLVSTHLVLRIFRPPRAARVAIASGQPSFIAAEGIRGKVLELAGPWRTSGDWWTVDPWSRDEWDIALSDGALYRLYCDPRGWFVEGSYD